jgi:hypothetical protein
MHSKPLWKRSARSGAGECFLWRPAMVPGIRRRRSQGDAAGLCARQPGHLCASDQQELPMYPATGGSGGRGRRDRLRRAQGLRSGRAAQGSISATYTNSFVEKAKPTRNGGGLIPPREEVGSEELRGAGRTSVRVPPPDRRRFAICGDLPRRGGMNRVTRRGREAAARRLSEAFSAIISTQALMGGMRSGSTHRPRADARHRAPAAADGHGFGVIPTAQVLR